MPRGNVNNLRTPTSEEAREIGRKGGLKSAETRQRQKLFRETLADIMLAPINDENMAAECRAAGLPENIQGAMLLASAKRAMQGDVEAARFVRDTLGQKPTESFNLGIQGKPIQSLDLSKLTDDELEALADAAD